jgi:hypothetical protein
MLDKLGEFLYPKIFVNIIINHNTISIYVEKVRKKVILESDEKVFSESTLNKDMIEYINSFTKDSPYYYISVLDISTYQGAISSCMNSEMDKFYDRSISIDKCYGDKWSYYTSKFDLDDLKRNYRLVGIDFVFSPFVVLAKFFNDKIDSNLSMFILVQESYITVSVFDHSILLFGDHFDTSYEEIEDISLDDQQHTEDIELGVDDESIDLEDVDIDDDLDDLDGFGDIEDLDSIEEIDEFADVHEEEEENIKEESNNLIEHNEEDFNQDYKRFLSIQESVKRFYDDERFDSKFVESVYIADSIGLSDDFKNYLEEEMFLSVFIRRILLGAQISELAQMELDK